MNDNIDIAKSSLDLWAEEPVDSVAADCCLGTVSTASTPLTAGSASSQCP
ncbi:hypothetical protein AB5J62_12855 [Amycolatopsis sp. cg5]